ncbi:helix-turn-helix domain-containing protein [Alteriqipengyuania lutimaris]|uniref:XRE family transcriptional regulator n=1 Tax=Alteriqipengyuania lutimaris TaxID=1538146 RepID=A0A395LJV3_9SPHN|nr:helix-turn-helix transcriptional regulator [Alteriqipengyuania lutimaris]MBB3034074.1 transcriptional regulator with XRE-family HTH domain [Alteriqipengyuania lutimaris]RDS76985.1 XRE family transcriptional regulator [Alteriqipengyuania lutimaris]
MEGSELRQRRKALGLTQAEMAARLHCSRVHLGQMERGKSPITHAMADQVLKLQPPSLNRKARAHDPLERIVEQALIDAGVRFELEQETSAGHRLDFHLPDHDIAIEVKAFHTPRVEQQLARYGDVILLQGRRSVEAFAHLVRAGLFPFPENRETNTPPASVE